MNVYEVQRLEKILSENSYPGRGIVLGRTQDGRRAVAAYFIMGRSANSRNRTFARTEGGIRTEAHDPAKVEDPSLIIYHPVCQVKEMLLVTNGDQTDTIRDHLLAGKSFEEALETRAFEPDAPNFTPRISGLLERDGSYRLSILKSADAEGSACVRQHFYYPALPGLGHFLHTYHCDGNPLPTFIGEPKRVVIPNDLEQLAQSIWSSLNKENKISLYLRFVDISSGAVEDKIINQYQ